jgi:transcriptional regulator with XRE-family HTH domain
MANPSDIGSRIKDFGLSKYASLKDFADALEMNPSNLHLYINNERSPGTKILTRLHKLGCDLNYLFGSHPNDSNTSTIEMLEKKVAKCESEIKKYQDSMDKLSRIQSIIKE